MPEFHRTLASIGRTDTQARNNVFHNGVVFGRSLFSEKKGTYDQNPAERKQVMMPNIDKVVVVTGASSGIGESTAKLLARHGAKVVLGARRKDRLDAAVKEISAAGGTAVSVAVDVTKRGEVEGLIRAAVDGFGRVDVIVNDAGIMSIAPIDALKVEEWDRMIDVNLKGLLYGVAAVLPIMQRQKQGHIINMASILGFKVLAPGGIVYSATKFAVRAVTEGLRIELK